MSSLRRLFLARFRLGMFDPPESYAYGRTPFSEDNSAEHRALSLQAARESMVLLKNERGTLPLRAGVAEDRSGGADGGAGAVAAGEL